MVNESKKACEAEAAPKKRKGAIVAGVVVAIVVVAGAGFFVWHEQPSFCNAICHIPMDAYVESYVDGDYDKYGVALESDEAKNGMMAYMHGHSLENGESVDCLGCHVPTIGEQVSEGLGWVSGSYEVIPQNSQGQWPLATRSLDQLVEARGLESGEMFCLNESCHANDDGSAMTRDDLVEATADLSESRNPHEQPHGDVACSECHKAHTQSVNACSECHDDAPLPEGWLSVSAAKAQEKERDSQ